MGLFKKKYPKNEQRNNEFLKNYAVRVNLLLRFTKENEKVTKELKILQSDFDNTVATSDKNAKDNEKAIIEKFDELEKMLQEPGWNEQQVLIMINKIGAEIDKINTMRSAR